MGRDVGQLGCPQEVLQMAGGVSSALSEAEALPFALPSLVSVTGWL